MSISFVVAVNTALYATSRHSYRQHCLRNTHLRLHVYLSLMATHGELR
ncbi:hypothetical protein [Thiofilum flexile]|nr:hypothetical protein [Thiofilum flexile]